MNKLVLFSSIRDKEGLSEEQLTKKARRGDVGCFEELVKKYKSYLYKIGYSYTKNEDDTLDLIQECTYRAWLNIKHLKKDTSFKFWISKILINIAISSYRKDSKIVIMETDKEIVCKDEFASIEKKVDLYEAIDLLKPEYKTVIILKYFDDKTIEDISYFMDIPQNTVKTYLRRAKDCIKSILKEDYLYEE
ncbi:MAG: sigma-70 family RNA polymerase sigma factor [Romboutsia sp.]